MSGKRRGIGMACGLHVSGNRVIAPDGDGAMAQVRVHEDGTVHVLSSEGDIGQGANTIFAQIAAEELGVPYDQVFIDQLDTDMSYFGVGACASRVTLLGGNAVRNGAIAARERLVEAAANKWGCEKDDVQLLRGKLVNLKTEADMDISQAATHYVGMTGGSRLLGEGRFRAEGVVVPDKEKYGNISLAYAFATHVAEVEVDEETGHVEVLRLVAVHDPGRVLNPLGAEGQVEGGLSQGMWFALGEEYRFHDGRLLNPNFTDYAVPTSLDVPEMIVDWAQTDEPNGPYGAKSLGEMALVPTPAAIANAIYDAVGIRLTHLPMTSERVYAALKRQRDHAPEETPAS
jgi:CO/xanthine dehydrogenase Mo-binding subunit